MAAYRSKGVELGLLYIPQETRNSNGVLDGRSESIISRVIGAEVAIWLWLPPFTSTVPARSCSDAAVPLGSTSS